MIQIHINPTRVEKVLFVASTVTEENRDLSAWVTIRPLVTKIDKLLKKNGADDKKDSQLAANRTGGCQGLR